MNNLHKRYLLFLLGCIPMRITLVYLAKTLSSKYLKIMGYIALLPAIGFLYIYITNGRKTGGEVFGGKIWWNNLRPVHSLLYFIFSFMAINEEPNSYIPLLIDVTIGFLAFLNQHNKNN
jgi:hypothetical protein|tara:strand:- start:287 stop:643 length:357 start_codon:yes stop_codon:yes gene_type:complete